jgi:hypothetical protein
MRAEDLITTHPTAEAVADALRGLPTPAPEAVEALRKKLDTVQAPTPGVEWPAILQTARLKRDTRYADAPSSHRPVVGPVLVMAKRAFRLAFQPFINEALRRQVEFNEAILDALALIHEHQRVQAHTQARWRQEVEERLAKLSQPPSEPLSRARTSSRGNKRG